MACDILKGGAILELETNIECKRWRREHVLEWILMKHAWISISIDIPKILRLSCDLQLVGNRVKFYLNNMYKYVIRSQWIFLELRVDRISTMFSYLRKFEYAWSGNWRTQDYKWSGNAKLGSVPVAPLLWNPWTYLCYVRELTALSVAYCLMCVYSPYYSLLVNQNTSSIQCSVFYNKHVVLFTEYQFNYCNCL
jgi:hypothetical protein